MRVRCAVCEDLASRYFVALNLNLWATCEKHSSPFEGTTVELSQGDLDEYFESNYEGSVEASESVV